MLLEICNLALAFGLDNVCIVYGELLFLFSKWECALSSVFVMRRFDSI